MRRKKGEMPIYIMFAIVTTIAGIALLLFFVGKNTDMGKKFYCTTFYNKEEKLDAFCEDFLAIEKGSIRQRQETLTSFNTGRELEFMILNLTNSHTGRKYIRVPTNLALKNAEMTVRIEKQHINIFQSNKTREILIVPLNRPIISKFTGGIPANSKIVSTRVEIYGVKYPSKANIVFVIDTSDSMNNEWSMLCSILKQINESLYKKGLNTTTETLGMGDGATTGKCMKGRVTNANINSIMPLTTLQDVSPGSGPPWHYPAYDDPREAWALAPAWLADNYAWDYDTDVKRIIIPISDSDPTGGGQVLLDANNRWQGDSVPSGNEGTAITTAVGRATDDPMKWVYIIPIYGDESNPKEGYQVGSTPCSSTNCVKVLGWMNDLATQTGATGAGAEVSGFSDVTSFLQNLLNVIITPFPSDVEVLVNNNVVWNFTPELNSTDSPQVVNSPQFVDEIQACVNNAGSCTEGKCYCQLGVRSEDGTIIFDRLRIDYMQDPAMREVRLGSQPSIPLTGMSVTAPEMTINVMDALKSEIAACPQDQRDCLIPIDVLSNGDGFVSISNLNISYSAYELEEVIFSGILSCWKETNKGQVKKNYLCKEIVVPDTYNYTFPVTEKMLTDMIIDKNYCHIIGNSNIEGIGSTSCGQEDNIRFAQDIYNTRNILIEYDWENKQIIVS